MSLIQWGPWVPDTSDYEGTSAHNIINVIPRGDGYGPFPSFATLTQALPPVCRGGFYALKSDGSVVIFAGTSTKLYQLNNTDFSWTDVSLGASTYAALTGTAQWQFAQTGNLVFATQANAVLQVFDLSSSTAFANALGSPPQAAYISVVGRFLVLSGLLSQPYRIQWSGLNSFNAAASWTSGVNSSDFQDFPDGGIVRGVAGGEFGTVFQDQAIRRMSFIPGSALIFQIERVTQDQGLFAPYSIIRAGSTIYFYSGKGFYKIDPGQLPVQIGREKVDRTFLTDLDRANPQLFMGAADPRTTRVYWAYKSISGVAGLYDKILGYDSALDRFFQLSVTGEYLLGVSQTGLTLENLDAIAPTTVAITGAANNGSGLIRIAVAATSSLPSTTMATITGVVGTTEANGTWRISIIDSTHFDLLTNTSTLAASAFANAYVSGGSIMGSLDAMLVSLDSFAPTGVQPQIAQFNSAHQAGFFTGPNLEATLESAEQGTSGTEIYTNGFRPITDAATVYGSVSWRQNQSATPTLGAESAMQSRTGYVNLRREARYIRFKQRIPAGTTWTFAAGIEPDPKLAGTA